uniref:Uncharacterized protein n=1 Tax=Strigamia maritima TaxID=126957 RepID=T1J1D4_STRMM
MELKKRNLIDTVMADLSENWDGNEHYMTLQPGQANLVDALRWRDDLYIVNPDRLSGLKPVIKRRIRENISRGKPTFHTISGTNSEKSGIRERELKPIPLPREQPEVERLFARKNAAGSSGMSLTSDKSYNDSGFDESLPYSDKTIGQNFCVNKGVRRVKGPVPVTTKFGINTPEIDFEEIYESDNEDYFSGCESEISNEKWQDWNGLMRK